MLILGATRFRDRVAGKFRRLHYDFLKTEP
jgi:hypothetical protein